MDDPTLKVRIEKGPRGLLRVLSPGVGLWIDPPPEGAVLGPGTRVGTLGCLNRRIALVLPEGTEGRIKDPVPQDRETPVEYGQPLFTLLPLRRGVDRAAGGQGAAGKGRLPRGTHAVTAPTDGAFYRGPSPGAPPFVKPGSRIRSGQVLGLVEVMKTFSQVLYGAPGLPDEAEVVEVRCEDGAEVRSGQILMVVR